MGRNIVWILWFLWLLLMRMLELMLVVEVIRGEVVLLGVWVMVRGML